METIKQAASQPHVGAVETADPIERALVIRAKAGDHDAFAAIVESRLPATFRIVMAILGHESDARDVTQAIFIQAWTNLPTLRDVDRFPAWFGRIVVNSARSSIRGRRRRTLREIQVSGFADGGESLTGGTATHETRTVDLDALERALDRLTPDERTVLAMHHYDDLSLNEMAARLGVRSSTVKSRLFTARRALERALEAEER